MAFSRTMKKAAKETACMTVDLKAVAANYRKLARRAAPAQVAPVVKADAYALGADRISRTLLRAGAESFFVARASEGAALRTGLPRARIFVLDGLAQGTAPLLRAHNLIP